jgi:phenylpyruvate tautomerase PptA (4-oxalocrotonate tautomerase family)
MPISRIAIRKGNSAAYKQALMDAVYEAMRETVHIKDGDRFQTVSEHEAFEFGYGANFLDIARTDGLVQIQIFWSPGKTTEVKQAMYKAIVARLQKNPGVRPEDVLINVVEAPTENWSFGNGDTQFYQPRARVA